VHTFGPNLGTLPYNITLTAGEMAVVLDNGDTQAYNLTTSCSAKVGVEKNPIHVAAAEPGTMTVGFRSNFFVLVRFNDKSVYRIWMGEVDNHLVDWPNTQAGANTCVAAVQAAFA